MRRVRRKKNIVESGVRKRAEFARDNVRLALRIVRGLFEKHGVKRNSFFYASILKKPQSKYYKILTKIIDFIEDARGDYENSMEELLTDYFESVFDKYEMANREPYFTQLSASPTNIDNFYKYIDRHSVDGYWTSNSPDMKKLNEEIDKRIEKWNNWTPEVELGIDILEV